MTKPAPKTILQRKGQEVTISVNELVILLTWTEDVDLDLLAFYRAKDGQAGGIFSENYPGGTLGSLETFPFIELSCDDGLETSCREKEEMLRISELSHMAEIYIVILNYTDAVVNKSSAFIDYDGSVSVFIDKWEKIEIPLNSPEKGYAAVVCKIDNTSPEGAKLINLNNVMDFKEFMSTVPGANMFVRVKRYE